MIKAMTQNIQHGADPIVAENGKLVYKDEAQKIASEIYRGIQPLKLNDKEEIQRISKDQLFCNLYHPDKDESGRMRGVSIIWTKDADEGLIRATLECMGLSFEKWEKLYKDFIKQEGQKSKENTPKTKFGFGLAVAVVVVATMVYMINKG